jgi:glycosyltransferase involved in cell wall biosynthesis
MSDSEIKISVIVPIYNVERYLTGCLASIASQTFPKESFEVILVDDGSTDGSAAIARRFAASQPHFKLISQENRGLSAARNTGLGVARGTYFGFVDSDDFVAPEMFEELYEASQTRGSDYVKCGAILFSDKKGELLFERKSVDTLTIFPSKKEVFNQYINKAIDRNVWNVLYHRSLFSGFYYPVNTNYEDHYVTPELLRRSKKPVFTDKSYYYYRKRNGSITRSFKTQYRVDKVKSLNVLFETLKKADMHFELSEEFSSLFFSMIKNYHHSMVYRKPQLLTNRSLWVKNLIDPEIFEFVFANNNLSGRDKRYLKQLYKSHALYLVWQKARRIQRLFSLKTKPDSKSAKTNSRSETGLIRNYDLHCKRIQKYASLGEWSTETQVAPLLQDS